MTPTQQHPQSVRLSFGFLHIGPQPRKLPPINQRIISESIRKTLSREFNQRIVKLQRRMSQGKLTGTEAIIGVLECSMGVKAPRVFQAVPVKTGVSK